MDVHITVEVLGQPKIMRSRTDVAQRSLRRLLHHIAKLSGGRQLTLAVEYLNLSLQNRPADLGPREARNQSNLALLMYQRVAELSYAQEIIQVLRCDRLPMLGAVLHHPPSHLAAHVADLAFQVAHPSLAGIAPYQQL